MSRLTKKLKPPYERVAGEDYVYTSETRLTPSFAKVEQKLGQLEDIEEELKIDLITLFKALKKGFYDNKGEYHHFSNLIIDLESIYDGYTKEEFTFADYGKTWVLPKEELL